MRRVWDNDEASNLTDGLDELCRDWLFRDMLVVEIGSFAGVSTMVLAQHAGIVIAVEPFLACDGITPDMMSEAMRQFFKTLALHARIRHLWETSQQAAQRFPDRSVDAVYIDGSHRETDFVADVNAWLPKLFKNGLLMGHDWSVVARFLGTHFKHLPRTPQVYADDSWVIRLK